MTRELFVFIGTYTENIRFGTGAVLEGRGKGIYIYRMDPDSGTLTHYRTAEGIVNPSYLCPSPDKRFLYSVNELKIYEGKASGSVSAFSVDPASRELRLLNKKPTRGTDPCHVCLNDAGTRLFVSNFMSGSVCVFPVRQDGGLGEALQFIQHEGAGIDPRRQAGPHAHSLTLDARNRFAFVPDLGLDKVMVYAFDPESGRPLVPGKTPFVKVPPGAGPRHFEFHPGGKFAYLINELASSMTAFRYDAAAGALEELQTVPTVPAGYGGRNTCADVHIAPSGNFIYGSNRGHDSIVIYKIDEATGLLEYAGHESTQGKTPRNFAVEPSGRFLLAANQDSDTIVTFRIDGEAGRLSRAHVTEVPTPVCVIPLMM